MKDVFTSTEQKMLLTGSTINTVSVSIITMYMYYLVGNHVVSNPNQMFNDEHWEQMVMKVLLKN